MKRVVVIGDLHIGSILGVVPHSYNPKKGDTDKLYDLRESGTEWLFREIGALGPIDYLILNGDLVEGKNYKGHGREVIMPDMSDQMRAARDLIMDIPTPHKYVFIAGTAYHTVNGGDAEKTIASYFNEELWTFDTLYIEGVRFRFRHHLSNNTSPISEATGIVKELVKDQQAMIKEKSYYPNSVLVFSHTHRYKMFQNALGMAVNAPALKYDGGVLSRYNENMSDFGFLEFIVEEGECSCRAHLLVLKNSREELSLAI